MHHLPKVMKIIKEPANHKYIVYLPNQVLQELDRLKTNGHTETRKASQKASQEMVRNIFDLVIHNTFSYCLFLFVGGAIPGQK